MLQERVVVEGTDVFFVCKVDANPPINKMVEWFHNVSKHFMGLGLGRLTFHSFEGIAFSKVDVKLRAWQICSPAETKQRYFSGGQLSFPTPKKKITIVSPLLSKGK